MPCDLPPLTSPLSPTPCPSPAPSHPPPLTRPLPPLTRRLCLSGVTVSHLDHSLLTQTMLGSRDHSGWLYIRPTFQCVQRLMLPPPPFLVALLLQKWETPWAKVFPIRLMLRLGAQYRCECVMGVRAGGGKGAGV